MKKYQRGFAISLVIAIIAVLAIGCGVYYYLQSKGIDNKQAENIINSNSDTRQLLTPEDYKYKAGSSQYADLYNEFVKPGVTNLKPPTTWVTYENKDGGIEFSVPYNPDWGSAKYKIAPYEYEKGLVTDMGVNNERIVFGPIQGWEGGGLARLQSLSFIPARSADFIVKNTNAVVATKVKTINGLQVVELSGGEFCAFSEIEIIGKKYNYLLSNTCDSSYNVSDDSSTIDMKYLERIVEKVKIINN